MTRRRKTLWDTDEELTLVNEWMALGLGVRTIDNYLGSIRYARTWCQRNGYDLETIPAIGVAELASSLPYTWSSRRRMRSALEKFWEVMNRVQPPVKAIRCPSKPQMVSKALDEKDALRLEQMARSRQDREGLVVLLGLYMGLRANEIANLQWSNFDVAFSWVTIVGKGYKTASLPVHPVVRVALQNITRSDDVWVFKGRFGGPVHPNTIWDWVRRVATQAELDPVATHVLRHTCLTTAYDATLDLRSVQAYARHSRPETTAGYIRSRKSKLVEIGAAIDYSAAVERAS